MATGFANRCMWVAAASGTGDFVVSAAALNGYTPAQCTNPAVVDGTVYHYFAVNGAEHEEGDGAYTVATTTLARTTVRNSSTGAKVSFSAPPIVTMGGPVATDMAIGGPIPSGISGSVLYIDTSGNLAQDNAAFNWYDGGGSGFASYKQLAIGGQPQYIGTNGPALTIGQGSGSASASINLWGWNSGVSTLAQVFADFSGVLNLSSANGNVQSTSAATAGTTLSLNNTSIGGKQFQLTSTGSTSAHGAGLLEFYDQSGAVMQRQSWDGTNEHFTIGSTCLFGFGGDVFANSPDVILTRDAAGILAQRNGTNAQTLRAYNTTDSTATNYERAIFDWQTTTNVLTIGTQAAGTGTVRDFAIIKGANTFFTSATTTVALLPAAGVKGRRHFVTDANATTFQSIVAGGGANNVPVFDDGTNWRIG